MAIRNALLVLSLVTLVACAESRYEVGQATTIQGTLVIKGSAPKTHPVLQTPDGTDWELDGLQNATALQNRSLDVYGIILRWPATGPSPARIEVLDYTERADAPPAPSR